VQTSAVHYEESGGDKYNGGDLAILGDTPYHPVQPVMHIIAEEVRLDNRRERFPELIRLSLIVKQSSPVIRTDFRAILGLVYCGAVTTRYKYPLPLCPTQRRARVLRKIYKHKHTIMQALPIRRLLPIMYFAKATLLWYTASNFHH